ncbi:MAG: DUF1648 domain-containing protein [Stackebrandtia sp.]
MTLPLITTLLTIATVTAVWWSIPAFARPQLPFGVRVPPDRVADESIAAARRDFTGRITILGVVAMFACLPVILLETPAAVPAVFIICLVVADTIAYILANRAISAAKRRGDWYRGTKQAVVANTSLRTDPVRVRWRWLVPAGSIFVLTAVIGAIEYPRLPSTLPALDGFLLESGKRVPTGFLGAFHPVLAQAGLIAIIAVVVVGLGRTRPELDASRPAGSARRYRRYLESLSILLFITAAAVSLTLSGMALRLWELAEPSVALSIMIGAPLVAAIIAAVVFQVRVGQAGDRLPAEPGEEAESSGVVQRDDDRYWYLGGFVYANRDDPAIFVHPRIGGSNWTINLGHPVGRVIVVSLLGTAATVTLLSSLGVITIPSK